MSYYAGIDVSLEVSHVCVIDGCMSAAICGVAAIHDNMPGWSDTGVTRVDEVERYRGGPSGPRSGLAVELLETRHVRNAFNIFSFNTSTQLRSGLPQLMRRQDRPFHCNR